MRKSYLILPAVSALMAMLCVVCSNKQPDAENNSQGAVEEACAAHPITENFGRLRDTIVGRFNGVDVDTLISEPAGPLRQDVFGNSWYLEWRVFTKNGTVDELRINSTIGLDLMNEGDLDGNGTDEWGFINQWYMSSWTGYYLFTFDEGRWKAALDPISIWYDDIESGRLTEDDIARPANRKGYALIKHSYVPPHDDEDYDDEAADDPYVAERLLKISPKDYILRDVIE